MNSKRLISLFICAMMILSLIPAAVFADGEMAEDEEIVYADDEVIAEEEEEIHAEEASDEELIPAEEPEQAEVPEEEIIPENPEAEDSGNEFENIIASGTCGDNLTWELDGYGYLTIKGTGPMTAWSEPGDPDWYTDAGRILYVNIGSGVTTIGPCAFEHCTNLRSVTIPETVETICPWAFGWCENLSRIEIPKSVTHIDNYVFVGCSKLQEINVNSANSSYKSVAGVLFTKNGKGLCCYPAGKEGTSYTVPEGVEYIGGNSFIYCSKLTSVTLPTDLTSIGDRAFMGCGLTEIKIPAAVTNISGYVFYNCKNLKTIYFTGKAPNFYSNSFGEITATAYYPAGDSTWTSSVRQNYGGNITWKASGSSSTHGTPVISGVANHADYMIVRWGKVVGAVSYTLAYREGTAAWQRVNVPLSMVDSSGNPRYDVKNTTQGAPYTFFVTANFSDGSTTRSENASQVRLVSPTVTVNRYGTTLESSGFKVSWNSVSGGSQYKIYYREKGTGSWTLYAMIPMSKNTYLCNIKASVTNANANMPNIVGGKTYEFAVLTAQSQANITSGFPTSPVSVTFTSTASASGYVNRDGVNMRTGPGTSYTIIATLYKGTTCQILEELSSGWTKVVVNGSTGYVSSSYITKN